MEKGESRVQQLQEDVEEVRVIMQDNIEKAREREGKLEELDERAESMLKSSTQFRKSTKRVRKTVEIENTLLPCKNRKVIAVIAGVVVLVIIVIIVIIVASQGQSQN
ncbi:synaptobrevin-1 [Pangasianodon hypophthalmus]|uniref:synaptobrevin-1 n=1 Tax=Pangasianodon hypophthalmus TaxID=310915 RepID=UPI0023077599|nr:synaptobrevin-1 [Pangasianodon hypophthalmus]